MQRCQSSLMQNVTSVSTSISFTKHVGTNAVAVSSLRHMAIPVPSFHICYPPRMEHVHVVGEDFSVALLCKYMSKTCSPVSSLSSLGISFEALPQMMVVLLVSAGWTQHVQHSCCTAIGHQPLLLDLPKGGWSSWKIKLCVIIFRNKKLGIRLNLVKTSPQSFDYIFMSKAWWQLILWENFLCLVILFVCAEIIFYRFLWPVMMTFL